MPKLRFVNYQRLKISLLKYGVKKLDRECQLFLIKKDYNNTKYMRYFSYLRRLQI